MSLLSEADEIDLVNLKEELSKNGVVVCPVRGCDEDFRSFWGLKYHLKQSNHESSREKTLNCQQCNLIFQSEIALQQHTVAEHSGFKRTGKLGMSSPNLNKTKKRTAQTLSRDTKSKTNNNSSPKLKSRNNETVSKTEMKKGFNKSSSCSENQSPKLTDSLNTRKGQRKTPKNTSTRKQNANNVTGQLSQAGLETSRHEGVSVSTDKTLALSESNMSSSKSSSAQESHLVLADVSPSKSSTELKEVLTKESGSSCSSNNLAGSLEMTEGPEKITLPTDDSSRIQCVDQHSHQDFETFSEEVSVNKSNSLFEMSPNGVGSNQNFQVDKVASEQVDKVATELEEGSLVSSSCDWNDSSKLTSQQRKKPINTSPRRQSDDLVCENYQTALGSSKTNEVISETRTKSLREDNSSCNVAKFLYQPENLFVGETGSKKSTTSGKGSEMSKMSHEKEITKLADTGMTRKGQQTCTNDASTRNADSAVHKNSLVNLKTSNLDSAILIASTKSLSEKKGKSPINSVRPTRASTRIRTPRKTFYEEKVEDKRACSSTSKTRGVKRKAESHNGSDEEMIPTPKITLNTAKRGDRKTKKPSSENKSSPGEPPVKRKREQKRHEVEDKSIILSTEDDEKEDDGKCRTKDEKKEEVNVTKPKGKVAVRTSKEETEDDQKETSIKTKPRKKKQADSDCTELARLKKYLKTKKNYLVCKNEGCGAKYGTAQGFLVHQKICGVKEEEREKFVCDLCGKEYITMPGLTYHMNTKHAQSTESDHSEGKEKAIEEPEVTESGRTRRKAASRALSKVQSLVTTHVDNEMGLAEEGSVKTKSKVTLGELDQLLTTVPGRVINKALEQRWHENVKNQKTIVCPCKGCQETFASVVSVKEHLQSCDKAVSYKCLACSKLFGCQFSARSHVRHWHVGFTPRGKDESDSNDADFELISSDESDDIEIEEIEEEGDSDMDEMLDDAEEIFVWDDKRRTYKKTKHKTPVHRVKKTDFVGDVYTATEKWRQEVHKHKDLFSSLKPYVSLWSKVSSCERAQYIPEETESPQFSIERKNEDSQSQQDIKLPLFASTSKEDSVIYGDVTFNVGGPVWAMDWCPVPDSVADVDQFLAISTHRSLDQVHFIHKTFSNKGLIQLWNAGKLKVDSASSGAKPTLSLGIAHNYGTIWEISWCPSGTWEHEASKQCKGALPRLGLMALACSDGLIRILSIPWPSVLLQQNSDQSSSSSVIMHGTPHSVLVPSSLGSTYDGQCGQAWCVKWHPHSMHEKIAAGFSDGSVAIWNLSTESVLLKEQVTFERKTFRLFPFLHISTNCSVVRELAWCPQNPDILITGGGFDRQFKLWNLKNPYSPITSLKRGIPTEIQWIPSFGSIVSSEEDCSQIGRCPNVLRKISFIEDKLTMTYHNSTIWTVSLSDWSNFLVCGDAAGEVVAVLLKSCDKKWPKFGIYRVCLESCQETDKENCNRELDDTTANQDNDTLGKIQESMADNRPRSHTTKEILQKRKLVFRDVNNVEFVNMINKSDPDVKRLSTPDTMQSVSCENWCNPQAVHKVRVNPNKQAFSWVASGGAAGLARIHLVKVVS